MTNPFASRWSDLEIRLFMDPDERVITRMIRDGGAVHIRENEIMHVTFSTQRFMTVTVV